MDAAELVPSEQERFLTAVFGAETGYLFVSTNVRGTPNSWHDEGFAYPAELPKILQYIRQKDAEGRDVYIAAQLYKSPNSRQKQQVKVCPSAWSDLDLADPESVTPRPTVAVETSPGRFHGFWRASWAMSPNEAEDISRRIAYAYHKNGADLGGWDLTQVLRVPGTHNRKYDGQPVVRMLWCDERPIPSEAFSQLPAAPQRSNGTVEHESDGTPPVPLAGWDLEHWQQTQVADRSAWAMKMVGILKDKGLADRVVEQELARHPIYLSKMREKWGNKETLVYDDIRRCIQRWREDQASIILLKPPEALQALDDEERAEAWTWQPIDVYAYLGMVFEQTSWIVPGFIREQAIVFDFGPPGVFKTILAGQLAVCIAAGVKFLNQYPTQQGRVLIVQEDTQEADFQAYLRAIVQELDLNPELLIGEMFVSMPADMKLDRRERADALEAWIEKHKPALVILDSFYLFHDSDGMTAKDLNPILRVIKGMRRRQGCAFWILDHDRKAGKDAPGDGNAIDKMYGGRPKSAACDAIVESQPVKGDKTAAILTVHKLRGSALPEPIRLRLQDGLLIAEGGSVVTSSGAVETVYQWLIGQGFSRTKKDIVRGTQLSPRSVDIAIGELQLRGLVKRAAKTGREYTWIALRQVDPTEQTLELLP